MTFKLRSHITVYAGPEGTTPEPHIVLSRERILRPGSIIKAKGSVATDEETKGPWEDASVKIRIIDEENLGIQLTPDLLSRLPFAPEGFWEPERLIHGDDPLILDDTYHHVWRHTYPETFTLFDRLRAPHLIQKKLRTLEGMKNVRRETEFLYEPSLPMQSRK